MSLDKALHDAMKSIPECLAGGYVDMSSGLLLSVKTLDSHPQEVLDMVAAATADLFDGPTVRHIENSFNKSRGETADKHYYFQEFLIFSENLLHVFMRSKKYPQHAICFVCSKSANVGMVLAKSRMAAGPLADAL
ncbi:hypothetical protein [Celeribacter sp. ULVN23_4]